MKSICKFELKSGYEDYQNEVNMLAHVIEENKVYLRLGKLFSFCIHGYFTVPSKKDVRVLGINVDLANFASIKVTNLNTGEVKRESSSINKIVNLEAGSWRIDYGIYKQDSEYVTPAAMFSGWIDNDHKADIPELTYIQVDPIVTKVSRLFIRECSNLTGAIFGELDVYPKTKVFDDDYSHNDVIINSYVSFVDNSSTNFLLGCSKIGNIYIADGVSGFDGCFGANDMWGETYDNNPVPTQIYLGKSVKAPTGTFMGFLNLNKITKYIVNPENPEIEYDSTVQALVLKGTHTIIAGLGLYKDNMLTIPSGYTIRGYREYEGRGPIIVDMSEYDLHTTLLGIRDLLSAELLILPKDLTEIDMYRAGFPKVETLIVPTKVAPICKWGDGIGNRTNAYTYAFSTTSNISGYGLGGRADKTKRKLYVIEGTAEEKATWTNKYDNWPNPPANTWQNGTTGNWERPNLWHDLTLSYNDTEADYKSLWNEASGPYQEFELIFVPENEMDTLILTKILEKLTEIQNRSN